MYAEVIFREFILARAEEFSAARFRKLPFLVNGKESKHRRASLPHIPIMAVLEFRTV
jgi:hypothetical protein